MNLPTPVHVIQKEIEERKAGLVQALVDAAAPDYAEYRAMCGEIRGLSYAQTYVTDLVRRLENGSDE